LENRVVPILLVLLKAQTMKTKWWKQFWCEWSG